MDSDGPLYLPYKTLVSTVSSMVFSEGEAQQLIEILTEKAGIIQDTWHMVGLPAPSWLPAAGALLCLGRCREEGRHHVFRQTGSEGQSWRWELNFPLEQRAGSHVCGMAGMGLKVEVLTDVPLHAGRPHRRVTQLLS